MCFYRILRDNGFKDLFWKYIKLTPKSNPLYGLSRTQSFSVEDTQETMTAAAIEQIYAGQLQFAGFHCIHAMSVVVCGPRFNKFGGRMMYV